MREIKTFYVNSLRECLYVLSSQSGECVIVDPGCQNDRERARVDEYIADEGLSRSASCSRTAISTTCFRLPILPTNMASGLS